jgi:crossover junction endodeoxyribonuclease RuvC
MRVMGVDPGSIVTGFGIVERDHAGAIRFLAAGALRPRGRANLAARLHAIHHELLELVAAHTPDAISLERAFVAINVQSAFRIGEARAMALLAAAEHGVGLFEYAPSEVKLMVAGYGRADKAQVKLMVRRTLGLDESFPLADDASDALALAVCHLNMSRIAVGHGAAAGADPRR